MLFLSAILLLSVPVIVIGLLALYIKLKQSTFKLILAFSAAYLFSTTIMHLLPEVYWEVGLKSAGLFIVIGFCIQLFIESFSSGIEHGHLHRHSETCKTHFPFAIIAGLLLHSFIEGMPVFRMSSNGNQIDFNIVFGLIIHNIPISFLFVGLLKEHSLRLPAILLNLMVFSLMAPLGMLFNYFIHYLGGDSLGLHPYITSALVTGIFLYISTAILFETGEEHRYTPSKIMALVAGVLSAYLISS